MAEPHGEPMNRRRLNSTDASAWLVALSVSLAASATAQKPDKNKKKERAAALPAVVWRDPGDAASLHLLYGAGGQEHAPNPQGTFTFKREDLAQTSPKFDVEDDQRVPWRVKLGAERSE